MVKIDAVGEASITLISEGSNYGTNEIITIADSELGNGRGESLAFRVNVSRDSTDAK